MSTSALRPIRQNPFTPFKVDQVFANPTSYGPHEGLDVNGPDGGNTDCGTPLYPLCEGTIISATPSTAGYGNLIIYQVVTPRGYRYIRYAHCQEFLAKVGDIVTQDSPIAKMGATGNSLDANGKPNCHLHWDILKKKPSNWRYYAKTKKELTEWFLDPAEFLRVYKDGIPSTSEPMPEKPNALLTHMNVKDEEEGIRVWDQEMGYLKSAREDLKTAKDELKGNDEVIKKIKEDHSRFVSKVAELIGSPQDEDSVIQFCTQFNSHLQEADGYKDKYEREVQAHKQSFVESQAQLEGLQTKVDQIVREHAKDIDILRGQIEAAISRATIAEEALATSTRFVRFWKFVTTIFNKGSK